MMRRRAPPPTKEGGAQLQGLDTNTFIAQNGTLPSNGTMKTPTKGYHSPHVSHNTSYLLLLLM